MQKPIFLFVFMMLVLSSCYYDIETELYGPPVSCDTSFAVSFSQHVYPIIQTRCLSCHFANSQIGGNVNLQDHSNIVTYANNDRLLGAISHSPTYSPMPKGLAKLNVCEIDLIKRWILAGSLDN
jgi:hypothetical protein